MSMRRDLRTPVARPAPPAWSTWREALLLIIRGYTWRTATKVALLVGTVLSAVNQGAAMMSGHIGVAGVIRVAVNYLVPFTVASISYLAPFRRPRDPAR